MNNKNDGSSLLIVPRRVFVSIIHEVEFCPIIFKCGWLIHFTYIIFEAFESRMFNICSPLIWLSFRVNDDVEICNVKTVRKNITKPLDLSHYLIRTMCGLVE